MSKRRKDRARPSLPERLDIALLRALRPWLGRPLVKAVGKLGNIGDEPPLLALGGVVVASGVLSRNDRLVRAGFHMVGAHLAATAMKTIGKDNIDRSRPDALLSRGEYRMKRGTSRKRALRSFPSGHTAGAVAIARAAARSYPEHRRTFYAGAALVGALQVPRRAHFPGDVLAGAVVGLVAEAASFRLGRLVERASRQALLLREH